MAKKPAPQLNDSHAQMLTNVCQSCVQTRELLNQVKDTGLDVSQYHDQNNAQEAMATKLKAAFFPNHV
jgi:hypothetical protein